MSFILDALKKSENERKRAIGPSLADAPLRRQQSDRPWWAVAVAALLVINLGVLLVVLTRKDAEPQAQPAPVAEPPARAVPAPVANIPPVTAPAPAQNQDQNAAPRTSPAVRSLAEEAAAYEDSYPDTNGAQFEPPGDPDLAGAAAVPEGPPIVRPIDSPAGAPLNSRPEFESRAQVAKENLPTLSSLIASGTNLPDLRLDIHVYSNKPAERFVFVNMRKYLEGQTLGEGPAVERITPDGVVLNSQGLRFLLPRQ
jgi:general secretion pathway protein B